MAGTVLIVDDDPSHRRLVAHWVERAGHCVVQVDGAESCLQLMHQSVPDAVLLDLHLEGVDGLELLHALRQQHPAVPVIMLTRDDDVPTVVQAIQAGAWDYVVKPPPRARLVTVVRNAVERRGLKDEVQALQRESVRGGYDQMVGTSQPMQQLFRQLDRISGSDVTVLLQGESGTGKDLVAQAVHRRSQRASGPFVAINCAAIPETLQDSELFGHEKGAFTGAETRRIGRFEQANGGTLFLDEVAELSPASQSKLLRVLQNRRFHRVGGQREVAVDVRIIAATHANLAGQMDEGTFRRDLFYRLAVFEVDVPSLRQRGSDIELLAKHFLSGFRTDLTFSDDALRVLGEYAWPGNVRELRNCIERASVLAVKGDVEPWHFPSRVLVQGSPQLSPMKNTLADSERELIERAIADADGNLAEVVRTLGIPKSTLYRRLRKYGLRR